MAREPHTASLIPQYSGPLVTVTAAISITAVNRTILADATGGPFAVLLPPVAATGSDFTVKGTTAGQNLVTLQAMAGELIDDAATVTLGPAGQYPAVRVMSDGSKWRILTGQVPGALRPYAGYITSAVAAWQPNTVYAQDATCYFSGLVYVCSAAHTSTVTFDETVWQALGPQLAAGAVEPPAGPRHRIGRQFHTDFSNQTADAQMFTLTGFTYATDAAVAAIQQTTPANVATVLTNAADLQDVDVLVRYRVAAASPYGVGNNLVRLLARYQDAGDQLYLLKNFGAVQHYARGMFAGAGGGYRGQSIYTGEADITTTTVYRYLRFRVEGNVIRTKSWMENVDEPDWQTTELMGATLVDLPENGQVGLSIQYGGGYITELHITELLPDETNLLKDPGVKVINSAGAGIAPNAPALWTTTTTGNGASSILTENLDYGAPAVFQCVCPGGDVTASALWAQDLYSALHLGRLFNPSFAVRRPWPRAIFPRILEFYVESKGANIVLNGAVYGGIVLSYYYSRTTQLNNTPSGMGVGGREVHPTYALPLGPKPTWLGAGTWDWTVTRVRIPIFHPEQLQQLRFLMGIHGGNGAVSGTVLLRNPRIRAVA